jgi:membrane protein YqaA with SNARE-associated domain
MSLLSGILPAVELTTTNVVPMALAYGFGSAWIPVLNAEVFVAAVVAVLPHAWWWPVLSLAIGQTLGKCVMFQAARHGSKWLQRRHTSDPAGVEHGPWRTRIALWSRMLLELLDRPWQGFIVVLLAASVGIPPLAIVAVVAGTRRIKFAVFAIACLIGRIARFLVLAWPIAAALT